MNSFFLDSAFAGVAISLIAYMAGTFLKKKLKLGLFNPLLISIIVTMVVLVKLIMKAIMPVRSILAGF